MLGASHSVICVLILTTVVAQIRTGSPLVALWRWSLVASGLGGFLAHPYYHSLLLVCR